MIVNINADGQIALLQPQNMREFKIVAPATMDLQRLAKALDAAADMVPPDHAWVRQAWIREQSGLDQTPDWSTAFESMLAYARSKKWLREEDGAICAHIERA